MSFSNFIRNILTTAGCLFVLNGQGQTKQRPNVVIILADDLGHGDLSINGGITPTPHLDRIMEQGVRFGNFMTNPVCTPTRGGMLTGMHPLRIGAGPEVGGRMSTQLVNLGNYFQKEGYRTGLFGKWHNSPSPNEVPQAPTVKQYGFDRFVGFYAGAVDYYTKGSTGWFHDEKLVEDEMGYATDLTAQYAIEFMDQARKAQQPFLCYVPIQAVHGPHVVKEELLARVPASILNKVQNRKPYEYYRRAVVNLPEWRKYNAKRYNDTSWLGSVEKLDTNEIDMLYSAIVTSLDDNVGAIMTYLQKNGLMENTIVLFFSDNGGTEYAGNNSPFRGFKHSLYEGGIHAPASMMIPKSVVAAPQKRINAQCGYLDVFPTLAALTRSRQALPNNLDGTSLVPWIEGKKVPVGERYLYWAWRDYDMLRSDRWKLFRYRDKVELFDLNADMGEKVDVSAAQPQVVQQMLTKLEQETKRLEVATLHKPLFIPVSSASAKGKMLTIELSSADDMKRQVTKILRKDLDIQASYYLEYDIKVAEGSDLAFCYFTPIRGVNPAFNEKMGVDMNGKLVQSPTEFDNDWKHVSVGLGTYSPLSFSDFGLSYRFKKMGKATVYLDNIQVKNLKGELVCLLFAEGDEKVKKVNDQARIN